MLARLQEYPNLFPGIGDALKAEAWLRQQAAHPQPAARCVPRPGSMLPGRRRGAAALASASAGGAERRTHVAGALTSLLPAGVPPCCCRFPELEGAHMEDILSRVAELSINGGGAVPVAATNGPAAAAAPVVEEGDLLGLGQEEPAAAAEEVAEEEEEEDVFADAGPLPAAPAFSAPPPPAPAPAAAPPPPPPAATGSGLTPEEEALLEDDGELMGEDLGVDEADLDAAELEDDWGLDDEAEEEKAD